MPLCIMIETYRNCENDDFFFEGLSVNDLEKSKIKLVQIKVIL